MDGWLGFNGILSTQVAFHDSRRYVQKRLRFFAFLISELFHHSL